MKFISANFEESMFDQDIKKILSKSNKPLSEITDLIFTTLNPAIVKKELGLTPKETKKLFKHISSKHEDKIINAGLSFCNKSFISDTQVSDLIATLTAATIAKKNSKVIEAEKALSKNKKLINKTQKNIDKLNESSTIKTENLERLERTIGEKQKVLTELNRRFELLKDQVKTVEDEIVTPHLIGGRGIIVLGDTDEN